MKDFLQPEEVKVLEEGHHAAQGKKAADRIKTILLLNEGYEFAQVAHILRLDETTLRRYLKRFKKQGIDGLLEFHYQGSSTFLSPVQEQELIEHLKVQTYQKVKEIVVYVQKAYQKTYSIEGMTHLLHRLRFVYRKTKVLPGKVDIQKQEVFKKEYATLKQTKKSEDRIYFLDASHPHHNNMPFYGWIYKGTIKTIKTNTGRKRVNLNGALNLEDMAITVLSEETINTHAMMRLVLTLTEKQTTGDIYLIVDNASYNHSYELELFLRDYKRVHLKYLPPYSPNLNIIERLWRFFHEKHHDRYFEKFKEFEQEVISFFQNIHQYDNELKTLLTDSFQTLPA